MGDQEPSLVSRGSTSIEAMHRIGYDAMALGWKEISSLGLAELNQRIEEADFPVLSANAYISGTESLMTEPYAIIPVADHLVGILGLTHIGTSEEVVVTDPLEAA